MLGGKWRLLIIHQLREKPLRPSELKRSIPDISDKMLTQELKTLIDSGLVTRKNYNEIPPKVDYRLTEIGKKAIPLIENISEFGASYLKCFKH